MRKILFKIIAIFIISAILIYCNTDSTNIKGTNNSPETLNTIKVIPPTIDEIIVDGIPNDTTQFEIGIRYETDDYTVIDGTVNPGQAITHILKDYNIGHSEIYQLEQASKGIFDLRTIQSGKGYTVICSKDSNSIAQCLVYEKSKTEYIVFDFRDTVKVYKGEKEIEIRTRTVSGVIQQGGGLWVSLSKQLGENRSPALVMMLANDIYAWTIDFFRIQANDSFVVYFEEKFVEDEFVGIGTIFAASFTHKGQTINAFRFNENEKYADYFDENGANLRRAFLKAPLDFYRISSKFSRNRKHPVTGRWKGHFGTDYAAPTGTPIMSTANGTITVAGYKKNNGNYVKVRHNDTYTTQYLHMSKIKKGIRKGVYVKQGDIIGYVGSTGLATGPHVCYRFWKNGKQVDPYTQKLPPSLPLKEENTEAFNKVRDEFIVKLNEVIK